VARRIERAILSVSDKTGIVDLAKALRAKGVEILSTGGTADHLKSAGVEVTSIATWSGAPEILGGRVKTLTPKVFGAILHDRSNASHIADVERLSIPAIDLVVVNLYPFEATVARGADFAECVENIDIGGPAMNRSAAKNHAYVAVCTAPEDMAEVLAALEAGGTMLELRRRLAARAFARTAAYDAAIVTWVDAENENHPVMPPSIHLALHLHPWPLRYGENPHQRAAFYRIGLDPGGLGSARQLHGPELSFNNIQDAAAAFALVNDYDRPAAAIIKHMNPCGLAVADELALAYRKAFESDTISAFGGVLAVNRPLDLATAELIGSLFLEVIVAPEVPEDVGEALSTKKARVLAGSPVLAEGYDIRSFRGWRLVQR